MILPLSGAAADYGQSIANSVQLAREDHPTQFANIEFVFEDALHEPSKAVSAFRKLASVDKVDLIYTWGVPFCKALAPIAESNRVPLIAQCIDRESTAGRRYVVRFMNDTDQYLRVQTAELARRGHERIGVVLAEHPYLEEMYAALERSLREGQRVQVIDRYQIQTSDMRSTIAKIPAGGFDVIGVFLYPGQIAQFYRQAREQKLELPTFGTNFFESTSELALAEGAMAGAVFTNNAVHPAFARRYRSRFETVSQIGFGALAYEFSVLLGRLFGEGPRGLSAEQILSRLAAAPPQTGTAAGPYAYRRSKQTGQYFHFPIAVKEVSGAGFEIQSLDSPAAAPR